MEREVKIFLADDHPIFREGLIKIIQQEKNFKICDCAGDGNTALEIIKKKKPHIAVLDISMPGLSGIEIAKIIMTENLSTHPIILTMYNDKEYLDEAMDNGVKGYLLKDSTVKEIINCIKIILDGGFYISKELIDHLIKNKKTKSSHDEIQTHIEKLTSTEKKF
jgi:DNA-binding NarL/FixJ family response regulator